MLESMEDLGDELCEYCHCTDDGPVNTNQYNLCEGNWCNDAYDSYIDNYQDELLTEMESIMKDKKIIFNGKATIVTWEDNTKTVVKCSANDTFDKEKGFLMAFFQKQTGMTKTKVSKFFNNLKNK